MEFGKQMMRNGGAVVSSSVLRIQPHTRSELQIPVVLITCSAPISLTAQVCNQVYRASALFRKFRIVLDVFGHVWWRRTSPQRSIVYYSMSSIVAKLPHLSANIHDVSGSVRLTVPAI